VITAFAAQAEAEMAINDAEDAPAWGEIDEWIVIADANAEEQSEIIRPPLPPPHGVDSCPLQQMLGKGAERDCDA
jgi:hypothetical protein